MKNMDIMRIKVNLNDPESWPKGQMDTAFLDDLNETDFDQIAAEEKEEARQDAAAYTRSVRQKMKLSQTAFADLLRISVETVRNWEQGKRTPTGAARALPKVIHHAPDIVLKALKKG